MAAFDALPLALRRALNENATKLAAPRIWHHARWAIQEFGPVFAIETSLRKIATLEENEIKVWAGRYEGLGYGPYPHVAAGATILRYGLLGPARNRRTGRARGGCKQLIQEVMYA